MKVDAGVFIWTLVSSFLLWTATEPLMVFILVERVLADADLCGDVALSHRNK